MIIVNNTVLHTIICNRIDLMLYVVCYKKIFKHCKEIVGHGTKAKCILSGSYAKLLYIPGL